MTGDAQRPPLFFDIDGRLIPFGAAPERYPTCTTDGESLGIAADPLVTRINPEHGRRLAALPCEFVRGGVGHDMDG